MTTDISPEYAEFLETRRIKPEQYEDMTAAALEWYGFREVVRRAQEGECLLEDVPQFHWIKWCLTHDVQDDAGHARQHSRVSTLD